MSGTYRDGMNEGLRLAAEIVRGMEGVVNERLEQGSASTRTRDTRRTRAQAYRNAAGRIETRLRGRGKSMGDHTSSLEADLSRLGL